MLTLNDGRAELWQWDTGRTLAVDADCSQVHFSNKVFGRSIDVDVIDGVAIIPDILLQTDKDLNVWAFVGAVENGYTKISKIFKVNRRNKPADYVFTPQEQILLKDAIAIVETAKSAANDAIESAKQAEAAQQGAEAAKDAAELAKTSAETAANNASKSAAEALTAKNEAETAKNAAAGSANAAQNSKNAAAQSAEAANTAKTAAQEAAGAAQQAAADANASAQRAAESVETAKSAANDAIESAKQAQAAQQGAETAKDAAELAQEGAETAANNASNSAAEALTAKNEAEAAKNAAAGSAENAQNSANAAGKSAEDAGAAKTAAQEAAGAAQQYAGNAAQSAAAAAESAETLSGTIADVTQLKNDLVAEQAAREEADNALRADMTANANADAETKRSLNALWKLNQGITYEFQTDDAEAYSKTVPGGAKLANVNSIGGKTVVWSQLIPTIDRTTSHEFDQSNIYFIHLRILSTDEIKLKKDHKYLMYGDVERNITENDYVEIMYHLSIGGYIGLSVRNGDSDGRYYKIETVKSDCYAKTFTYSNYSGKNGFDAGDYVKCDNLCLVDLTQLFGAGNEPTSTDDPRIAWIEQYATAHPEYNSGKLVSADVESVKYNDTIITDIPASVRAFPGYGWSAGAVYNGIERTETGWQYVQRVGSRDYQYGDTVTDGTITYYELGAPIITDITEMMENALDAITVETGGTLTFENAAQLPAPNSVEYAVKLSEVIG